MFFPGLSLSYFLFYLFIGGGLSWHLSWRRSPKRFHLASQLQIQPSLGFHFIGLGFSASTSSFSNHTLYPLNGPRELCPFVFAFLNDPPVILTLGSIACCLSCLVIGAICWGAGSLWTQTVSNVSGMLLDKARLDNLPRCPMFNPNRLLHLAHLPSSFSVDHLSVPVC